MGSKINYSLLISLFLVVILILQQSPVLWPGVFFFLLQLILLLLLQLLVGVMQRRQSLLLLPVIRQFQYFFGIMFPLWIGLAVAGYLATPVGRIFALFFVLALIALSISLLIRLFSSTDLLDRFK